MRQERKKVLLIAPLFFGYYKEILSELNRLDYDAIYVCDAPSNSNISKAIGRINKNLILRDTRKYFSKEIEPLINKTRFDYVLLVGGMTFALMPDMVGKIREKNPDARFIMYQWDSEKNLPYSTHIHQYFDLIFSFDLDDCNANKHYIFLPLFYTRQYEEIGQTINDEFKYDCSYIGTAHPKKYQDVNQIATAVKDVMPRQFIYHYMPSILKFVYHKLFAPEFKKARYKEFYTEKLSSEAIAEIIKQSKCVLDAPQAGQTGLTIRTIESLGARRKIITTNEAIKKYDFYKPTNIYVFKGEVDMDNAFFSSEYDPVDKSIYEKYSLENWLKFMFEY